MANPQKLYQSRKPPNFWLSKERVAIFSLLFQPNDNIALFSAPALILTLRLDEQGEAKSLIILIHDC